MISNVYERRLLDQIQEVPRHVVLVVAEKDLNTVEEYKKLGAFISWCLDIGISRVTVYINMLHLGEEVNQKLRSQVCLLYTSDAADEEDSVDLGGRRIIKKKKKKSK